MGGLVRSQKIADRAADVLAYLEINGPATLADIVNETGLAPHVARYATALLYQDGKAHITHFQKLRRPGDHITRHVAVFAEGEGVNAYLHTKGRKAEKLNWGSTKHLQSYYMNWALTRCPVEIEEGDEGEVSP